MAPKTAQLFLTRMCNQACDYCCVRDAPLQGDALSPTQWIGIVEAMERTLGIEAFKFGGGEPTLFGGSLLDIIQAARGKPSVVLTNGFFDEDYLLDFASLPNCRLHFSVNEPLGVRSADPKTKKGWERIALCTALRVKAGGNVIVSKSTIKNIRRIVFDLGSLHARINLCPLIAGPPPLAPDDRPWRYRPEQSDDRLTAEDMPALTRELEEALLVADRIGAEFTTCREYIVNMAMFGHRYLPCRQLNEPHLITIDADGFLMACPDVAGHECSSMHVNELLTHPRGMERYIEAWQADVEGCSGCYLSSIFGNPLDQAIRNH